VPFPGWSAAGGYSAPSDPITARSARSKREREARKAAQRQQVFLDDVRRRRGPLTIADARDRLSDPLEELRAEIEHVRALERRLGLRVVECARWNQGSASREEPIVAVPPTRTRFAIATRLHEIGHKADPCRLPHQRRPSSGGSSVCVSCELNAWMWARAHVYAYIWWPEQQDNLRAALGSYSWYATPAERCEIEALCAAGPTPFAAHRLRILNMRK
jgi:hypothetical protein